jgi:hypothetical protein
LGHSLYKGQYFFLNGDLLSNKRRRILQAIQKYKLSLGKSVSEIYYWQRMMLKRLLFGAFLGENI